jgi:hypothetical protein
MKGTKLLFFAKLSLRIVDTNPVRVDKPVTIFTKFISIKPDFLPDILTGRSPCLISGQRGIFPRDFFQLPVLYNPG